MARRAPFVLYGRMLATVNKRQPHDIDRQVGENLRRLRTARGLSQFDLAGVLDISSAQLQKYEAGQNRISAARLYWSAWALGVTLDDIFAGCGGPLPPCNGERPGAYPGVHEESLLVDALRQIEEPVMRKMIISFIKALAAGQ